jgi:hypothetical protein
MKDEDMDDHSKQLQDRINEYAQSIPDDVDAMDSPALKHFEAAIATDDPLGMWIRAHLYMESELTNCLRGCLRRYDEMPALDLSFAQKLHLLYAIGGISKDYWRAYKQFNSLRNGFAHANVEDGVPDVMASHVRSLWDSIDPTVRSWSNIKYVDGDDFKLNLRRIVIALLAYLFTTAHLLDGDESRYDWLRYQLTGQSVFDRTREAAANEQLTRSRCET